MIDYRPSEKMLATLQKDEMKTDTTPHLGILSKCFKGNG